VRVAIVWGVALALLLCAAAVAQAVSPPPAGPAPGCTDRRCHGGLTTRAHVHPPVKDADCTSCHQATQGSAHPDSSRVDFTLTATGGELCAQCHGAFDGGTQHPPAAGGDCLSCHDPHGSAIAKLLRRPVNETCFECHEAKDFRVHALVGVDLGSGHPVSGAADPSRKGESLSCAGCHDPHATDTPNLWKFGAQSTFDLCGNCHQK